MNSSMSIASLLKQDYYSSQIESTNQDIIKNSWHFSEQIKPEATNLPLYYSSKELADRLCEYFSNKITKILEDLFEVQSTGRNLLFHQKTVYN